MSSLRIAVLVSGNGSNLQAIIDAVEQRALGVSIVCVIADRDCWALSRAERHGIPHYLVKRGSGCSAEIDHILQGLQVSLVVLAGFLSILSPQLCEAWKNKIINLHPSLLPKYGGAGMWGEHVHKAVLQNKEIQSGVTIHFVTSGIDEGEIIAQAVCDIDEDDTPESLSQKVHALEHPLLIDTLKRLAQQAS